MRRVHPAVSMKMWADGARPAYRATAACAVSPTSPRTSSARTTTNVPSTASASGVAVSSLRRAEKTPNAKGETFARWRAGVSPLRARNARGMRRTPVAPWYVRTLAASPARSRRWRALKATAARRTVAASRRTARAQATQSSQRLWTRRRTSRVERFTVASHGHRARGSHSSGSRSPSRVGRIVVVGRKRELGAK